MNELGERTKLEKVARWVNVHKWQLIFGGAAVGLGIGSYVGSKKAKALRLKADAATKLSVKPDPYVRLVPNSWNAGKLYSLDWSEEDALICIEGLMSDDLGTLGKDLLGCAMKEGEPVNAILHIFYDVENSQE